MEEAQKARKEIGEYMSTHYLSYHRLLMLIEALKDGKMPEEEE